MLRLGPLRLHWSLLLGAALFCALEPGPLLLAGYAAVLAAHVLGHSLAAMGSGARVSGVMVHALGGELLGEGDVAPVRRSLIALGGVGGQLLLLAVALLAPMPDDLRDALTRRNGLLLLMSLIPVKPLDGAQAWKLPARLRAAHRQAPQGPSPRQVEDDVADLLKKIRGSTRVR